MTQCVFYTEQLNTRPHHHIAQKVIGCTILSNSTDLPSTPPKQSESQLCNLSRVSSVYDVVYNFPRYPTRFTSRLRPLANAIRHSSSSIFWLLRLRVVEFLVALETEHPKPVAHATDRSRENTQTLKTLSVPVGVFASPPAQSYSTL